MNSFFKIAGIATTSGGLRRLEDAQGFEERQRLRLGSSGFDERLLADIGGDSLDLGVDLQGSLLVCAVTFGFKAHAHDAVEGQGRETDHRLGADAIRQEMVNRGDLDVAFEDSKAPLDVGEPLLVHVVR